MRGRGTKEAPLSVQSPRKRLDLGDRLAKFKVIFVHLRKTLPYKLSICFRFAVALCFLAVYDSWRKMKCICVYLSDTAFAQHLLSLEMLRRAG